MCLHILFTNNDLESFVPCSPKKFVLKLFTAAISDSSEEPNKLKNNVLLTINSWILKEVTSVDVSHLNISIL